MQFLKTLLWVVLAIVLVLFASENWNAVTIRLWGGLEADVKLPVLMFGAFLLGFLPMLIIHYARLWSLRRRIEARERHSATLSEPQAAPAAAPAPPTNTDSGPLDDRIATDAKAWPTP